MSIILLFSLYTPFNAANAAPAYFTGGVLDNLEGKYGAYNNSGNVSVQVPTSTTLSLTDSNISTAFTLAPNTMVWFDIPDGINMIGYRFVGDPLLDILAWYNPTSGASVSSANPQANGILESFNWSGVKRIAVANTTAQSRSAYEFNAYLSGYTVPSLAYFTGGMIDNQTMSRTSYSNTANIQNQAIQGYSTALTDNNLGTGITLPPRTMLYFNFPSNVNITSYRLSASNSNVRVLGWKTLTGGLSVVDTTPSITSIPKGLSGWTGMRRVAVSNDTSYSYTVYEFNVYGTGFTPPDLTPPSTPAGVIVSAGSSQVNISWTANVEPDTKGYNIYQDGILVQTILSPATSHSIPDLVSGRTYSFEVSAFDNDNNESPKSTQFAVTLPLVQLQEMNKGRNTVSSGVTAVDYLGSREVDLYSMLPYQYSRQAGFPSP